MKKYIIFLGDIVAIGIVTVIGFATHRETDLSFLPRFLAIFLPLIFAWFLLAPWFELFQKEITSTPKQLWRPVLAMIYAAPLAAVLRGFYLGTAIIPIFAVILAVTSAIGMLVWRAMFTFFTRK